MALFYFPDTYHDQQKAHMWQLVSGKRFLYRGSAVVLGTGDIGYNYAKRMKIMGAYVKGICRTPR